MPATIYFSGAISGGRADLPLYRRIVAALEEDGHRVLAGAVTAEHIGAVGESLGAEQIFNRDLGWIEAADILVAEVSMPSTGVGYEIAAARHRYAIPVVCLYRPAYTARCSAMVAGDRGIETIEYHDATVEEMLKRLRETVRRLRE